MQNKQESQRTLKNTTSQPNTHQLRKHLLLHRHRVDVGYIFRKHVRGMHLVDAIPDPDAIRLYELRLCVQAAQQERDVALPLIA